MSKKDKSRRKHHPPGYEPRTTELATMAWMLTTVTTLICVALMALSKAYVQWIDREAVKLALLAGLLLFASLILGVLALGLELVVLRIRRQSPPRPVTFAATLIALLPIGIALWQFLLSY